MKGDEGETVDDDPRAPATTTSARAPRERYELGEELARGGTGRVCRAHDRQLEREVAVKSLLDPSAQHGVRFAREARVTARLQHPSIVPIYDIGRLGDGQPYYAMKLVSGRTLDEAIRETSTLAQRLALLPALIGVADAIAYAHAQRVIHRDLKPHNVVLGPFGESLVIDWGLAKQLDAPATTDANTADPGDGDPVLTLEGTVLGTPVYMPPEQAAGKPVDARADVYALGAMLYHLLAGQPPYRGPSSRAVLISVLEEAPPPIASRVAGIPADLVAIVDKAMAREPADRYADAQQLVADLRRFQTGQLVGAHRYTAWSHVLRFVRRHIAAVVVAAVLGTALVVGSVVAVLQILAKSELAEQQRKAAEAAGALAVTQRDAAEELAAFMLDDLRARLEPIGRLDLLHGVGERVQSYYATLAAAGLAQDDTDVRRRAQALALIGEAELDAGALASSSATLAEVHRVATAQGDRALAARAGERLGTIERRRTELDAAERWLDGAFADALDAGQLEIATRAKISLAWVLGDQGEWERAYEVAQDALALARDLHDVDPAAHIELADALVVLAVAALTVGAPEPPNTAREARALLLGAADEDPYDHRVLAALVRVDDLLVRYDPAAFDALHVAAEAVELSRRVRALEPTNMRFVVAQQGALEVDATARALAGDGESALSRFREALAVAREGARMEPDNHDNARAVSYLHNRVGDCLMMLRDFAAAEASYRESIAMLEQINAEAPFEASRIDLGASHHDRGSALEGLGRNAEALREYEATIAMMTELAGDGDNTDANGVLAEALIGAASLDTDRQRVRERATQAIALLERTPHRNIYLEEVLQRARALLK